MSSNKEQRKSASHSPNPTVPELEQAKTSVLDTLPSVHSRRSYKYAIEKFIDWYCSTPRLGFNRSVMVRYRSFLESLMHSDLDEVFRAKRAVFLVIETQFTLLPTNSNHVLEL